MNKCSRCNYELYEYYYISYMNSEQDEEGHFFICSACKRKFDEFMKMKKADIEGKEIGKQNSKFTISFNIPDNYEVIRGDE